MSAVLLPPHLLDCVQLPTPSLLQLQLESVGAPIALLVSGRWSVRRLAAELQRHMQRGGGGGGGRRWMRAVRGGSSRRRRSRRSNRRRRSRRRGCSLPNHNSPNSLQALWGCCAHRKSFGNTDERCFVLKCCLEQFQTINWTV